MYRNNYRCGSFWDLDHIPLYRGLKYSIPSSEGPSLELYTKMFPCSIMIISPVHTYMIVTFATQENNTLLWSAMTFCFYNFDSSTTAVHGSTSDPDMYSLLGRDEELFLPPIYPLLFQ